MSKSYRTFGYAVWLYSTFSIRKGLPILPLIISLLFSSTLLAQDRTVSGIVRGENGEALPGANILVRDTDMGTATGIDGNFSLLVPAGKNILVVSSVGYESREISITGQTFVEIQLEVKSILLEDAVVVAYGGTQKKETLSGAISSVKGIDIIKAHTVNVSNSLAGQIPGLTVVAQGGEPGNDFSTILVRGVNTFGDASPLFVVDGIPLQTSDKLQRIDPGSIESITVLKDASAAIYGSQGANGVILITTKRGSAGKINVSASFNESFSQPTILPDLLSSYEIALLQNEVIANPSSGVLPATFHPSKYNDAELSGFKSGNDQWHYATTDWMDETLKKWALQNYSNITVSGGTEKIRGLVSLSSRYQDGFYKEGSNKYRQFDIRTNTDWNITRDILFSMDVNIRQDLARFSIADAGSIFSQVITATPTKRAYWPDGTLGQAIGTVGNANSPVAISTPLGGYNDIDNLVFNGTLKLNIRIPWVEGLSFTGTGTLDRSNAFGKLWTIPVTYYNWDEASTTDPVFVPQNEGDPRRTLTENTTKNNHYLLNFLINYDKKWGEHAFKLLAGYEEYEKASDYFSITKKDFEADNLDQLIFGNTVDVITQDNPGATRWRNYLGRINYDYRSKILAEFVCRYQGSSIFHPDYRWGFFPGGSLAYRISEERFWKDHLSFISYFKIRASYGITGNDLIAPFQYMSLYETRYSRYIEQVGASGGLDPYNVLSEGTVPYVGVTWEKAKQLDIGFDAELLKNSLNLTFDYFYNRRDDILTPKIGAIPGSTGIIPSDENIGKFQNKGFDFNIQYHHTAGQLSYQISMNGLYSKNKLLFFDEIAGIPEYQQQTGHPIGGTLYYRVLGVYKTAGDLEAQPYGLNGVPAQLGDLIFEDVNKDGMVDSRDMVRSYKTGTPTVSGGLSATFRYRNFDMSLLFQGAFGAERYMRPTFSLEGNYLQSFYDNRWTPENADSDFPRIFDQYSAYWSNPTGVYNTFFVRKTDYVRLKNAEFGYTLPQSFLDKVRIETFRVYISGLNLLTFAPDLKDYDTDPEQTIRYQFYGESYPLQRTFTLGINLTF
ncbi:MAG: TonB-dependent receptor [Bacteroidales bacterium]|nr:TonB-dependent receptor [Lentimicrobiaceae bacterium]MDD5695024.1 TonB-dependent receptor [Bacteroidales bacterium]